MPAPAPRPSVRPGQDVRLLARQALDYGDANARRLEQGRAAYDGLVRAYAAPK